MGLFSARRTVSACALSAATVAALMVPGAASAATQCSGSNIVGAGSSLQKLAQEQFDPAFNTSANATACSGTQGNEAKPKVTYESVGSGAGLENWGVKGHAFEVGRVAIATTDEAVNAAEKTEIEKNETKTVAETVQTIPILQAADVVIVNLPTGCTASNTIKGNPWPGRLVLRNVTLQKIWVGEITKWSQIEDEGDKLSGAGCNPESTITRVVRLDGSGTTHIFKKYLGLISTTPFETEKGESKDWDEIAEGGESTTWPTAAHVVKPLKTGNGAVVSKVAETPSSLAYTNLADARTNGAFSKTGVGGVGTGKFWTPIQNNGLGTTKAKFADPSTDGDTEPLANAHCEKTKYTNGSGTKFPPKTTADSWSEVTTATKEKAYPICGLTYDMVLSKYSAYPGTTEGEAITAENFLTFVLETETGGGQLLILNHDYEPLPTKLLKEARKGAALSAF